MFIIEIYLTLRKHAHYCLKEIVSLLQEYYFARRHGLVFVSAVNEGASAPSLLRDAEAYEPSRFAHFGKVMEYLGIASDDVFVDLGCGKGRVVCFAAAWKPRRVVGIELVEKYAAVARRNARKMTDKLKVPIDILTGDAAVHSVDDGTIYYLFNPFGEATLRSVLANIRSSLAANPRRVRIVYYHPSFERALYDAGWLRKVRSLRSASTVAGDISINVWENTNVHPRQTVTAVPAVPPGHDAEKNQQLKEPGHGS